MSTQRYAGCRPVSGGIIRLARPVARIRKARMHLRLWLLIAAGLTVAIWIDDWASSPFSKFVIPSIIATVTALLIPRAVEQPAARPLAAERSSAPKAELLFAMEHIQSIRVLLEVGAAHHQPVPRAALINLELVLKNLRKLTQSGTGSMDEDIATAPHHSY